MRIITTLFLLSLAACAHSEQVYFGIAEGQAGNIFYGYFDNGVFQRHGLQSPSKFNDYSGSEAFLRNHYITKSYNGYDPNGKKGLVKLNTQHIMHGEFDGFYQFVEILEPLSSNDYPVLFTTGPDIVKVLAFETSKEKRDAPAAIKRIITELFNKAVSCLAPEERYDDLITKSPLYDDMIIGEPLVYKIKKNISHNVSIYLYPLELVMKFNNFIKIDDRATAFILFDNDHQKILFSSFGHPEWSPMRCSSIRNIKPILAFTLEGFKDPLILVYYQGPWESYFEYAILNLRNGEIVLTTDFWCATGP